MNIPNALTFSRLLAALLIGVPFLIWSRETAGLISFVLFVVAALTDFFDGYLARKWKQVSELGRMMDPIADKVMILMILGILLGLFGLRATILIPASIIIFREVFVSGMREFLGDRATELKVTQLAKWKTASQMISISIILLGIGLSSYSIIGFGIIGLWLATVLTAITGIDYAQKALRLLK